MVSAKALNHALHVNKTAEAVEAVVEVVVEGVVLQTAAVKSAALMAVMEAVAAVQREKHVLEAYV